MLFPTLLLAIAMLLRPADSLLLEVSSDGGNSSGALAVGLMFEDVNQAGDGGIHAQLLGDNAFQGTNASLMRYDGIGDVKLEIDSSNPLSKAIVRSLKVSVAEGAQGKAGFSHDGYWGIKLPEGTYTTFFWMSGEYEGDIDVKLVSKSGYGSDKETEFGATKFTASKGYDKWDKYETKFDVKAAPGGDNLWTLTFDASKVAGSSLHFTLMSLYPPTFMDKPNGLKPELAQPLADIQGRFLRFLGGNNLEGNSLAGRFKWNESIGPLEERPGRQGVWKYPNSDALGLMEYLDWTEYMNLEPILNVFSGLALGEPGEQATGSDLDPYIEEVLNEIEYVVGDTSGHWGGLRAQHGHPHPYNLKHVEIGNEDNLAGGCDTYVERFQRIYDAIHKAYPDIILLSSTANLSCLPDPVPKEAWLDYHRYGTPKEFVDAFNEFDNIPRDNKYIVNEFGVIFKNNGTRAEYTFIGGAVAEAVWMIGIQRNSDLVQGMAYAPLIMNKRANELYVNWNPAILSVRNDPDTFVVSVSYYVQQMFSLASSPDDTYLDVKADGDFGPVYWVASKTSEGASIMKLANYGGDEQDVSIDFGTDASKATVTTLAGKEDDQNDEVNPNYILPTESEIEGKDGKFELKMPGWSVIIVKTS